MNAQLVSAEIEFDADCVEVAKHSIHAALQDRLDTIDAQYDLLASKAKAELHARLLDLASEQAAAIRAVQARIACGTTTSQRAPTAFARIAWYLRIVKFIVMPS